jgi:HEAT repeat protein
VPLIRKPSQTPAQPKPGAADVLTGLGSANADERWAAARAAAGMPECAAVLAAALPQERDPRVREAMFTSLARIGTRDSIAGMLPMLRSDDSALRTGALDALSSSVIATHELLPQLLNDPDIDVRILSCELARHLTGEEATGILSALLTRETEANVCAAAIEVLAEVGNQSALPALAECARRFPQNPFLTFAIQLATDRITAAGSRG